MKSCSPPRVIRSYDVLHNGIRLAKGKMLVTAQTEGAPEGLRVDVDGNLLVRWLIGNLMFHESTREAG